MMNHYTTRALSFAMLLGATLCLAPEASAQLAGPTGGPGGVAFVDPVPADFREVAFVDMCDNGSAVSFLRMGIRTRSGRVVLYPVHGSGRDAVNCEAITLASGEFIRSISGRAGRRVESITITTSRGRSFSVGGTGPGTPFSYTVASSRFQIAGFRGRSGTLIDALGVAYRQTF